MEYSNNQTTASTTAPGKSGGTIAFAFDIDGVLVRSAKALPGASETISLLQDNKIPFIFLTNGGGLTEEAHAAKVGQRLGLQIDTKQFVQSHSPFHELVPLYHDKTVLVIGGHGHQIRDVAHAYGFTKVVTSSDLMMMHNHLHPFPEMTKDHHHSHGRAHEAEEDDENKENSHVRVSAIMVWSSPRDWCLDLQVVMDLLISRQGRFGTVSKLNGDTSLPNNGYQQDGQPPLYFCNPDLEWATAHPTPRVAQGAFRVSLEGLWAAKTKGQAELACTQFGKPTEATYLYGEKVLQEYHAKLHGADAGVGTGGVQSLPPSIKTVYMVGDNPESDIRGANTYASRYGSQWKSILVESGVHVKGTKPAYKPTTTVRDVKEAVMWALAEEDLLPDQAE